MIITLDSHGMVTSERFMRFLALARTGPLIPAKWQENEVKSFKEKGQELMKYITCFHLKLSQNPK